MERKRSPFDPGAPVPEVCEELLARCPEDLKSLCMAVRCEFILWARWGHEVKREVNKLRHAVAQLEKWAYMEGPPDSGQRLSGAGGTLDQPDVGDPPNPPWGD